MGGDIRCSAWDNRSMPNTHKPSFDAEDLHVVMNVLRELAESYPNDDAPDPLILRAAANIAATRTTELLEAHLSERDA